MPTVGMVFGHYLHELQCAEALHPEQGLQRVNLVVLGGVGECSLQMLGEENGALERLVEGLPFVGFAQADGTFLVVHFHETVDQAVYDVAAVHERPFGLVDAHKGPRVAVHHPGGDAEDGDDNGVADGYLEGNAGLEHVFKLSANVR